MNAKSKLVVKYDKSVIEMNSTFAKMSKNPLSDEYSLLQKTRTENPGFVVSRRQINTNSKKDTYKGLTYEYMKMYIMKYEPKESVEEVLAYLENMILISKCHGQRLRYPTIKKWFLGKYPEVAKFGTIEFLAETRAEENVSDEQNTIPISIAAQACAPEGQAA